MDHTSTCHKPHIEDCSRSRRMRMIHDLKEASIDFQVEGREHRDPMGNIMAVQAEIAAETIEKTL